MIVLGTQSGDCLTPCTQEQDAAPESGFIEPVAKVAHNKGKRGLASAYLSRSGGDLTTTGKTPVFENGFYGSATGCSLRQGR
jgi:hypothetical protein